MEKAIERERRHDFVAGVKQENPTLKESMPLDDFSGISGTETIQNWNPVDGSNLLIAGATGSGKTYVSDSIFRYCLGLSILDDITFISEDIVEPRYRRVSAYKISPINMIADMSSNYFAAKHSLVSRMIATRVLIIDGLGHEKVSHDSFWQSSLLQVLDDRLINRDKKTIITTHLGAGDLKTIYRDAIARRIIGNHFAKVILK